MTFAQPIRRPVHSSSVSTSPTWLTSGISTSSSAYNGSSFSSTGPPSGGSGSGVAFGFSGSASAGAGDNRRHEQDLINAYEAEEERIINVLSRKLEQLREDKIDLENALEAESESHVNKLSRELQTLRQANRELEAQLASLQSKNQATSAPSRKADGDGVSSVHEPSAAVMLDAMQRENEALRNRLVDTERDYVRVSRLNEVYREELIAHRSRLGLSVENLIGARDPFAQPTHYRSRSSSVSSSLSAPLGAAYPSSVTSTTTHVPFSHSVPIPRPQSQLHRPSHILTPLSTSPSAPLSPIYSISGTSSSDSYHNGSHRRSESGATPASFVSVSTNLTSPPGSVPVGMGMGMGMPMFGGAFGVPQRGLSYPSVPPPSLSSSFGSPTVSFHMPHRGERDASLSPVEPLSRRGSNAGMNGGGPSAGQGTSSRRGSHGTGGERRVAEAGSLRRAGIPIGGRVAESGSLVGRSRAGSVNLGLPETVIEDDADVLQGMVFDADNESDTELYDDSGTRLTSGKGIEGTPSAKSR